MNFLKLAIFTFILLSVSMSALGSSRKLYHLDSGHPQIKKYLLKKGFKKTVNRTLFQDCKKGKKLSCAVLGYRLKKTRKNARKVTRLLKQKPCRVSKMNHCLDHLFARIYMEKHQAAKRLARKMCRHRNKVGCRQLKNYRTLGNLKESY